MTRNEIIDSVQRSLDAIAHNGFTLHVFGDGVRKDGAWWYVPVEARGEAVPPPDFLYSTYATIEADLAEETSANVLLVPMIAESKSS